MECARKRGKSRPRHNPIQLSQKVKFSPFQFFHHMKVEGSGYIKIIIKKINMMRLFQKSNLNISKSNLDMKFSK
jgi:hypothetical protein